MKAKNENPVSRLLATGLIVLLMTGCSEQLPNTGAYVGTLEQKPTYGIIIEEEVNNDVEKENINVSESKTPLDKYIEYLENQSILDNIEDILVEPYEYSEYEQEVAAYQNLKRYNLSITDIADELHNILVYSQYPGCCDEELFNKLVGKLRKTLSMYANPFSSYYILSQKIHELDCNLVHTNSFDIYSCDELKKQGEAVRPKTFYEYLEENMADDIGFIKIKEALKQNPDHYLEDYLTELENLIIAQQYPTSLPPDLWYELFGKLLATLNGQESLYDTFISLAVHIHNVLNPEDILTKNDMGIYVRTLNS